MSATALAEIALAGACVLAGVLARNCVLLPSDGGGGGGTANETAAAGAWAWEGSATAAYAVEFGAASVFSWYAAASRVAPAPGVSALPDGVVPAVHRSTETAASTNPVREAILDVCAP